MESGAAVTDHVIQNPDELTVTFSMSNAGDGTNAARDVFESFKKMKEEARLLEVETEHALYRDMVIVSLSPLHSAPFKGAQQCTLGLQKISRVQLTVVGREDGDLEGEAGKTHSGEVEGGQQEPKVVDDARSAKLKKLLGGL
ncbi:MAG: hypothetical protein LIP28_09620 [Deltaproteobacteria bacterium]|nr:hypothetical protein [Deltaproteobacteria bacterium]